MRLKWSDYTVTGLIGGDAPQCTIVQWDYWALAGQCCLAMTVLTAFLALRLESNGSTSERTETSRNEGTRDLCYCFDPHSILLHMSQVVNLEGVEADQPQDKRWSAQLKMIKNTTLSYASLSSAWYSRSGADKLVRCG